MDYKKLQQAQQNNLRLILKKQKFADVTFIVGKKQQEFIINRVFMATISPVFEAMLYGQMMESKPNSDVIIEDIDAKAFEQVIKFAYYNKPELTAQNIHNMKYIAHKYQIQILSEFCDDYFRSILTKNNFCTLLTKSVYAGFNGFVKHCEKFLKASTTNDCALMIKSDGFLQMSVVAMKQLLKSDYLVLNEEIIWEYVLKWAEHQANTKINTINTIKCSKLELLSKVKKLIRFGLMSGEYLAKNVQSQQVLTDKELVAIYRYKFDPEKGCGQFSTKERRKKCSSRQRGISYYSANY